MKPLRFSLLLLAILILLIPGSAWAQTYSFRLLEQTVDVYINEDGSASLQYEFVFANSPGASPIDYVDVGLPNPEFNVDTITAEVDGRAITDISRSGYQGSGNAGVALGLGSRAIQPGQTGRVRMFVGYQGRMVFPDTQDPEYASTNFSPTWFGSEFVEGTTELTVRFHLPPGVQPEEPRWHAAPRGWADEPMTALDDEGRVLYTWSNATAEPDRQYEFGASFPRSYLTEEAVTRPNFSESVEESLGVNVEDLIGFGLCCGIFGFVIVVIVASFRSSQTRRMQYLPPKIAIEGHGIKRGLTAVEAAILLEQPLDKVLTMILFGVIKKEAASVTKRDPLEISVTKPLPEGLHPYEVSFLEAFDGKNSAPRRRQLQNMMVELVKSLGQKMKGFSRKETIAYYRDIMNRAWAQVEAAQTPEVRSEKYNEVMEWTMLDRRYEDRTRDIFRTGPVYTPVWWPRYDPTFGRGMAAGRPATSAPSTGGSGGGGFSMPQLPGSQFAASVVGGAQSFATSVVGNLTDFTGGVTNKTNPVPVTTTSSGSRGSGGRSSGGGGCACACACACAGCACACAGGGR